MLAPHRIGGFAFATTCQKDRHLSNTVGGNLPVEIPKALSSSGSWPQTAHSAKAHLQHDLLGAAPTGHNV